MQRIYLFFILLAYPFASIAEENARILRLGCVEWPPYIAESLPGNGFLAEMSQLLVDRSGQELDMVIMPWKRVLQGVEKGSLDGSVCMFKTRERLGKMHYIEPPLLVEKTVIFHRSDFQPDIRHLEDLNNYTLGVLDGAGYQKDDFIQQHPKLAVVNSFESLFKMLAMKRVDLILAEYRNGMSVIQDTATLKSEQFSVAPLSYQRTDVHLVISRNIAESESVVMRLNKIANEVIQSDAAKALYKRHSILELPALSPLTSRH